MSGMPRSKSVLPSFPLLSPVPNACLSQGSGTVPGLCIVPLSIIPSINGKLGPHVIPMSVIVPVPLVLSSYPVFRIVGCSRGVSDEHIKRRHLPDADTPRVKY